MAATDYVVSAGNVVFTTAPANLAKVLITKKVETYNTLVNPEVAFILQLLKETNIEVQSEGWVYNTESHVEFSPVNNKIPIPSNVLRLDVTEDDIVRTTNVVKRGGFLYDKIKHTNEFTTKLSVMLFIFGRLKICLKHSSLIHRPEGLCESRYAARF